MKQTHSPLHWTTKPTVYGTTKLVDAAGADIRTIFSEFQADYFPLGACNCEQARYVCPVTKPKTANTMSAYSKTRDLQEIARRINEKKDTPKAGYYDKAAQPRVYLSGVGYNTKKMRTKVWLTIEGDCVVPHCRVECDSQPRSWTESQENEILDTLRNGRLLRWLNRFHVAPTGDALAEIEQVMQDESLLETVYGVVPEWRETRVAINRFGKLATRNRLFLVLWSGPKINAPRKFEEISKSMFDVASKKWTSGYPGTPCGYKMCEPGPQAEAMAEVLGRLAVEVVEVERLAINN